MGLLGGSYIATYYNTMISLKRFYNGSQSKVLGTQVLNDRYSSTSE
jgi:hypothetical protein